MGNYCSCNNDCTDDELRSVYAVDYDSLIERLEKTRNEIDDTIKLLKNRKTKDAIIDDILSYDEDDTSQDIEKLLNELKIKDYIATEPSVVTNTKVPYKHKICYPYKYPFRWYPTVWL